MIDSARAVLASSDPDITGHRWTHPGEVEQLLGPARTQRLRAALTALDGGGPGMVTITEPEI